MLYLCASVLRRYGLGMIVGYAVVHGIKHIIYKLPKGKDAKKKLRKCLHKGICVA